MARHFSDFLSAYFEYARDGFAPDRFHKWTGLSILAAAVERKVTLKQGRIHHVPNIYVMLVSHPAVGKSTAMEAGTNLIEEMRRRFNPNFKIIPNQTTEPAFIDLMKIIEWFQVTPTLALPQSAGYFYASEASSSALQNTCGDFVASMTAFYDCPKFFRKKLKGEKDTTEIENGCMNMLAGSTFNYLKNLVNESSVLGGFASRLIYVVQEEREVRPAKWESSQDLDSEMANKLIDDLGHINRIVGPMKPTPTFTAHWEAWKPAFDQYLIDLNSEKLEAIMSRKGTNIIKVAILLSLSESDSRILTEDHFYQAKEIVDDAYKDNPLIIASAAIANVESQKGTTQLIGQALKRAGGRMHKPLLMKMGLRHGNGTQMFRDTVEAMLNAKLIAYDAESDCYVNLVDPDSYL